jgi:hypothetical protein
MNQSSLLWPVEQFILYTHTIYETPDAFPSIHWMLQSMVWSDTDPVVLKYCQVDLQHKFIIWRCSIIYTGRKKLMPAMKLAG